MKHLFLVLSLAVAFAVDAQQLVPVFDPVIAVTPNNTTGSTRPRIALVRDSVPAVMWTRVGAGNDMIYFSRWTGAAFSTPVIVSPAGLDVYCSAGEGGDIAARGDTVFIVFFTADSRCFSLRSIDGGITWGDTVRIDHSTSMDMAYTPDVQIMPGGNPVVIFEASDMSMTATRQMVTRSDDGGQTWNMEQPAHTSVNGSPCECCPPTLLAKDSMVYALYRNNLSNVRDIVMTVSSDSGMTFPVFSQPDITNWVLTSCPTTGPEAMFYSDSIIVTWKSISKIYFGTMSDADGTVGNMSVLEPGLATNIMQRYPSVCGGGDTVIFTWDDTRSGAYDTYMAIMAGGPQIIDTVFRTNDTTGTAETGVQQTSHAAFYNGVVHLVYQDLATSKVMYRRATVSGVVSVPELEQPEVLITTYPNPVADEIVVQNPEGRSDLRATITDANGKIISVTVLQSGDTRIDSSMLARGTYFLNVGNTDGTLFTTYFIKQ